MKKSGVLNDRISQVIASMGHLDMLTIGDAGLPIPLNVERIDMALVPGIPSFMSVVNAVANDLEVQQIFLAKEIKEQNPAIEAELLQLFSEVEVIYIPHSELKVLSSGSRAAIRTGECTSYANVILVSGVTF
jgi:D-ribose pyranase